MPRAKLTKQRLYTSEITTLQRLLKFTNVDERIPPVVRQQISAEVNHLVTALSNAHTGTVAGEIVPYRHLVDDQG